jgi:phosphoserine aminotransferase
MATPTSSSHGRIHNFSAGPAVLPVPVLEQARDEMLNWQGSGMSVMEMSHRGACFESIIQQAEADLRALANIPANYKVLFLQGGAHLQFSMVPMNFLAKDGSADYIITGSWGKTAFKEAGRFGKVRLAHTNEKDNCVCIPTQAELDLDPKAAYVHYTSNETIHGLEWTAVPVPPEGVPLICDTSSDMFSGPFDITKYGMVYAGAQKNLGPAGVLIAIVREDMLARVPAGLPLMMDYKVMADSKSLFNTPPCYSIYVVGLVLKWLINLGGLEAIARHNAAKAGVIYQAIDESGGYYRGHARADSRSKMNITFRLGSEDLEKKFIKEATAAGLDGLKGHRSVGGLRASLYNAQTQEAAAALVEFMKNFQAKNA